MASKRKLWKTLSQAKAVDLALSEHQESGAAVYRWVQVQAGRWHGGDLKDPFVVVYVDERDGRGWQIYDRIDLREIVAGWQVQ